MSFCLPRLSLCLWLGVVAAATPLSAQSPSSSSSSSSSSSTSKHVKPAAAGPDSSLDAGSVANGVYRNKMLSLSCKIPAGWVLRTEEMNEQEDEGAGQNSAPGSGDTTANGKTNGSPGTGGGCPHMECGKVLLAAFSRPPAARAEDVNSSILIAAERVEAYPGLKDAAQYFGPLTEVAEAQGFTEDEKPYEISVGAKTLARADFHKDVGTRVMRQSTLAMLSHGYAVSITVIAGTEEDVEDLIDELDFSAAAR